MRLHANAARTRAQRAEVRRRRQKENQSVNGLAQRFRVHPSAIRRWIGRESPEERSSPPTINGGREHLSSSKRCWRIVRVKQAQACTLNLRPECQQAVLAYRQVHPRRGPFALPTRCARSFLKPIADHVEDSATGVGGACLHAGQAQVQAVVGGSSSRATGH